MLQRSPKNVLRLANGAWQAGGLGRRRAVEAGAGEGGARGGDRGGAPNNFFRRRGPRNDRFDVSAAEATAAVDLARPAADPMSSEGDAERRDSTTVVCTWCHNTRSAYHNNNIYQQFVMGVTPPWTVHLIEIRSVLHSSSCMLLWPFPWSSCLYGPVYLAKERKCCQSPSPLC